MTYFFLGSKKDDDNNENENECDSDDYYYTSPKLYTITRTDEITNFDFRKFLKDAVNIIQQNMEELKSYNTLGEQIYFIVVLLQQNGNSNTLASFSQISTIFYLTKGSISSPYERKIEKKKSVEIFVY